MDDIPHPAALDGGSTPAETAWRRLRQDIIAGTRTPGERLRIDRLRDLYGIGPSPLRVAVEREALRLSLLEGGNAWEAGVVLARKAGRA